MKKLILILIVGSGILIYSCKKNENQEIPKAQFSDYIPMTIGNYWVYQEYYLDSAGNAEQKSIFDSTIISKDTTIDGNKFFKFDNFKSSFFQNSMIYDYTDSKYYRDSLKNLINPDGQICFSESNFTDTLYRFTQILNTDTLCWITCKMEKMTENVSTPAGSFGDVLNYKCTVTGNVRVNAIPGPRYIHKYFAPNVGEILHSYIYLHSSGSIERRLVSYKINK
jgi:hypothetical protein